MSTAKIISAAMSSALLLASANVAFAQGTTLAGPSQGAKANGTNSTRPAEATGTATAAGAAKRPVTSLPNGVEEGGTTATGGNPGGPVGRN